MSAVFGTCHGAHRVLNDLPPTAHKVEMELYILSKNGILYVHLVHEVKCLFKMCSFYFIPVPLWRICN
jgi:hypothetical protein